MKWKTIAITWFIIATLEGIFIGYLFTLGAELDNKETECAYDICADYPAYNFNQMTNICGCYENNEMQLWELMS